jgi:hypothetical protein
MATNSAQHALREDERGWHREHPKPRNLLNKTGSRKRVGTLGYRTSKSFGKAYNPREGKVNPPAPVTKRTKPTLEYVMGDTSMGAAVNTQDGRATIVHQWRGTVYPTWEAMQDAIAAQ